VIDLIAADLEDLKRKLDGRKVTALGTTRRLSTADLMFKFVEPDWRSQLLAIITNPNVAYLLMLLGIYGLILEFFSPGAVLPGVIGAISLLLALYAFHILPVNYAGLALVFFVLKRILCRQARSLPDGFFHSTLRPRSCAKLLM
jgi:membrane-bound serine protease (ClpP class)